MSDMADGEPGGGSAAEVGGQPTDSVTDGVGHAEADSKWSIRGVALEARQAAAKGAKRDGQTIGEWVTRALIAQFREDRERRAPAIIGASASDSPPVSDGKPDIAELAQLIELATRLAGDGPVRSRRLFDGIIRARLQVIRGAIDRGEAN